MTTRKEILEQLAHGEIDVNQAADLLNGAGDEPRQTATPNPTPVTAQTAAHTAPDAKGRRWLRIHVSDLETGRNRVRVNVPLGLVQFGLKIGARFTDEVDTGVMQDVMDALHDADITGTLVEVEDADDNERVHIFVE